jgi:hypothetical protein
MAKAPGFKKAKREVEKLVCLCTEEHSIYFRVTRIGHQIFAECPECLTEYGPWSASPMRVVEESVSVSEPSGP